MLSSIIVVKRRSHPVLKPLHPGPKLATTTLARLKRNALVIASVLVAPLVSPATGHAMVASDPHLFHRGQTVTFRNGTRTGRMRRMHFSTWPRKRKRPRNSGSRLQASGFGLRA